MALDPGRIEKDVQKLRKLFKKFPKNPTPEEVHDFRTRVRRVKTAVESLGLDGRGNERKLLRRLKRMRKKAGKVRDLDVLTGYTAGVEIERDEECECLIQLLQFLGARRYRAAKRLHQAVVASRDEARARLDKTASRLELLLSPEDKAQTDSKDAEMNAAGAALELAGDVASRATLGRNNLHPYRLKVKKLRDVLQEEQGSSDRDFVEALGKTKDSIGVWHDWEELASLATKFFAHKPNCRFVRALRATAAQKFEIALKSEQNMRRRYISQSRSGRGLTRTKAKSRKTAAASVPELRAVSAIAS